nr:MAG TPA: tail assembly chaperone protein [Caudoviricetes sp.]
MDYKITLTKPFKFEDEIYTEIDLSAIEELNTNQLVEAEKRFAREGGTSVIKEFDVSYACIICSIATGKPVEFFRALPAKVGVELKNKVGSFFYGDTSISEQEKN